MRERERERGGVLEKWVYRVIQNRCILWYLDVFHLINFEDIENSQQSTQVDSYLARHSWR